jgi:steroid delta-isomerase-like uncharacterized protein
MTTLSPDHLLEVVLRGYEEGWNRGNLAVLDQLLAPDFRAHDPSAPGGLVDRVGVRALLEEIRAAFPDLRREALDHVAHGDKIAVRWRVTGTHQGVFAGAPPTGRRVEVLGITFYHIPDDRIREEWVAMDSAELARQLSGS